MLFRTLFVIYLLEIVGCSKWCQDWYGFVIRFHYLLIGNVYHCLYFGNVWGGYWIHLFYLTSLSLVFVSGLHSIILTTFIKVFTIDFHFFIFFYRKIVMKYQFQVSYVFSAFRTNLMIKIVNSLMKTSLSLRPVIYFFVISNPFFYLDVNLINCNIML